MGKTCFIFFILNTASLHLSEIPMPQVKISTSECTGKITNFLPTNIIHFQKQKKNNVDQEKNSAKQLFQFFVDTGFFPKGDFRISFNAFLLTLMCTESLEFFVSQFG